MHKIIEDLVEVQAEEIPDIDESNSAKKLQHYHHTLEKWMTQITLKMYIKTMFGKWKRSTAIIVEAKIPLCMYNGNKAIEAGYL